MKYQQTARFRKAFKKLPRQIKEKTHKTFVLFQQNPQHPSLGVKKVQGVEGIWEGRIDISYRFTFQYDKDPTTGDTVCLFRNIGPHDIVRTDP